MQQQDVTRGDARLDHTINSKNSLFVRYSIFDAFTALPPLFGPQATGDTPSRAGKGDSRNQSMVLGDVHIFSGTAINEFRASYARIANSFVGYDYGKNAAADIGIPNINVFGATSSGLPRIEITGLNSLGVDAPIPALRYENNFQWVDNFTLIRGRHSLKFGADARRFRGDFFQISLESPRGRFTFDQNYTSNNGAAGTGLAPATVLLGYPAALNRGVIYDFPSNRITQTFYYVQDDFKITRKLTLNLGLRYELYIPPADRWDNQSNFDLVSGQMLLANRGGNSRALITTDKNNLAPRLGFAYALQPRTAIRGGYGISYYPDKFGASGGTLNNNYPFISLQQIIPADRFKPDPTLAIDKGIAVPVQPVLTAASVPLVGSATYFDTNYKMGYIQFWNFTIQHQFTQNMSLETAYVGTKGTHLFGNNHVNLNQPDPGPGAVANRAAVLCGGAARGNGESARFQPVVHLSRAADEAAEATANGLWLLATYTWAKAIGRRGFFVQPEKLGRRGRGARRTPISATTSRPARCTSCRSARAGSSDRE